MAVGAVIVAYQCRELLMACLESIQAFSPDLLSRTVVVDNASTDGTVSAVGDHSPSVRVIANSRNVGFAAAANAGIRALPEVESVCLLNPDAVLLDSGIGSAGEYLDEHLEVGVLGGRILNANGTIQANSRSFPGHVTALFNRHSLTTRFLPKNRWSRAYLMTDWAHDEIRPVDWVSGAFMLIHRRAIDAVGLLDDGYFWSIEDVDYCHRVHDAGLQVVYYPGASIRHRVGGSSRHAVYRAMAAHHRGMWRYYRKHLRGNRVLDALTFMGIWSRFGLHAVSYALRTARQRTMAAIRGQ
jgi:GT2 family glycosyltransferase